MIYTLESRKNLFTFSLEPQYGLATWQMDLCLLEQPYILQLSASNYLVSWGISGLERTED